MIFFTKKIFIHFFIASILINFVDNWTSLINSSNINFYTVLPNTSASLIDKFRNLEQKKNTLKRRIRTRIVKIKRTRKIPKTTKSSLNTKCGDPSILSTIEDSPLYRIINGYTTTVYSWPWIASIHDENDYHICSATIISEYCLLTAAHCVRDHGFRTYFVKLGIDQLTQAREENIFTIDLVYIHPGYDDELKNDLAIIKLKEIISFSPVSRPICLPPDNRADFPLNKNVVVIGWGSTTGFRPANSIHLQETVLRVINQKANNECSKKLKHLFCALDPTSKKSNICYGDSGGPMMIYHDNAWYLYGISNFLTGFSQSECDNTRPSYYSNVTKYLKWIKSII